MKWRNLKPILLNTTAVIVMSGVSVPIAGAHEMEMHAWTAASEAAASQKVYWLHGKVNDANEEHGVVNITHDPVKELSWPSMTMTFHVENKGLFEKLRPNSSVDFALREVAGNRYEIVDVKSGK